MAKAYVQLTCPECDARWEANPGDLPAPKSRFNCRTCGATRSISEFMRTTRDFEILTSFHEA